MRSYRSSIMRGLICAAFFFITPVGVASNATEIEVWHTMKGAAGDHFANLVDRFNASQGAVRVRAVYRGTVLPEGATAPAPVLGARSAADDGRDVVEGAISAVRSRRGPHLLQVRDDLAPRLWASTGLVRSMSDILPLAPGGDFDFFLPASVPFMKDGQGTLFGFPWQVSVPVLFYNKDAYRRAGLDPERPPRTWHEMQAHLLTLRAASGLPCAYTSGDQTWIHVENLSTRHGESMATRNNGLEGQGATLTINGLLHVRHTALMRAWIRSNLYQYSGRRHEGEARFVSGQCAILSAASAALGDVLRDARFDFGVAPLPWYEEGARSPVSTLVGGSSFWVMAGKPASENRAVATFLGYLASPEIAAAWHQQTGNLPLNRRAWRTSEDAGYYTRLGGLAGIISNAMEPRHGVGRGLRLPNHDRVREVIDIQLETVWSGSKPAKLGLDDAVRLGNIALRQTGAVPQGPRPADVSRTSRPASSASQTSPAQRVDSQAVRLSTERRP